LKYFGIRSTPCYKSKALLCKTTECLETAAEVFFIAEVYWTYK